MRYLHSPYPLLSVVQRLHCRSSQPYPGAPRNRCFRTLADFYDHSIANLYPHLIANFYTHPPANLDAHTAGSRPAISPGRPGVQPAAHYRPYPPGQNSPY